MFETLVMTKREKTAARTVMAFPAAMALQVGLGGAILLFSFFSRDVIQPPPLMIGSFRDAVMIQLPPPGSGQKNAVKREDTKAPPQDSKELKAPNGAIPDGVKPEDPRTTGGGGTGTRTGDDFMNDLVDPNQKNPPDEPAVRDTGRVIRSMGDVNAPRLLRQVPPVYPPAAVAMGLSGKVVLQIVVNEEGRVEDAQVVQSPNPIFNMAAVDAVRQWQYTRPVDFRSNQVVACYMTVVVSFNIR